MLAFVAIAATLFALAGLLFFTEAFDRRRSIRLVRRTLVDPLPPERVEAIVAQETDRLLMAYRDVDT